ncbi:hypothetical protein D037_0992B, partial [Vibrio parahaemolyticus IDH02640]
LLTPATPSNASTKRTAPRSCISVLVTTETACGTSSHSTSVLVPD